MPGPSLPAGAFGRPTGNARFRRGLFGRLILEAEFSIYSGDRAMGDRPLVWRDAPEWALPHIRYNRKVEGLEPLL